MSSIEELRPVEALFLLDKAKKGNEIVQESDYLAAVIAYLVLYGYLDDKENKLSATDKQGNELRNYEANSIEAIMGNDNIRLLYGVTKYNFEPLLSKQDFFALKETRLLWLKINQSYHPTKKHEKALKELDELKVMLMKPRDDKYMASMRYAFPSLVFNEKYTRYAVNIVAPIRAQQNDYLAGCKTCAHGCGLRDIIY